MVTPQREPLGVIDAWIWAREFKDAEGQRPGLIKSTRRTEGYERVAEMAATRPVYVADREGDIAATMRRAHALGTPADWLVRAKHNRSLPKGGTLWAKVRAGEALDEIEFTLPGRAGHAERQVRQRLFAARVTVSDGQGGRFAATCVMAQEFGAPQGVKPIEWRLLTNRAAATLKSAVELIDWYRARWEIEIYFHSIKNSCRVEALQLVHIDRLELALAVYMAVAWRLARLLRLGRTYPDGSADALLSEDEWRGAYILAKKKPPPKPPTLREAVRQIAMLGGFLGRKCDSEPGVKTIWLGFQRIMGFVQGIEFMRTFQTK